MNRAHTVPRLLRRATAAACFLLVAVACVTVAITGRSQVRWISNVDLAPDADRLFAAVLADASSRGILVSRSDSTADARTIETIERVVAKITEAADVSSRYRWDVTLVRARHVNAVVLPNGRIIVFAGLLPLAQNEAGLAAVLGHEVAHLVAEHQGERLSQAILAEATLQTVNLVLALANVRYRPLVGAAFGLGAQFGFLLPSNREQESEADRLGLLFMARAGYDPAEALAFWRRMAAHEGSGPWEFVSTHPSYATREAQIRQWLPDANLYFANRSLPLPRDLGELARLREAEQQRIAEARRARERRIAMAPLATVPTFPKGYWFEFGSPLGGGRYVLERTEACDQGTCNVFVASNGIEHVYTADYAEAQYRSPQGTVIRYDPPLRLFQWPLKVGDTWSHPVRFVLARGGTQQEGRTQFAGEVVDYDSVKTGAGEFLAFHVRTTFAGRPFKDFWYAPEARTYIKLTEHSPSGAVTFEVVNFQRTPEPSTPLSRE